MDGVRREFSDDEVIKVVLALGSNDYRVGTNKELIFQTVCHHGNSYKLYYYQESRLFHCYTDCGDSFDIFELVKRSKHCSYQSAVSFIESCVNESLQRRKGFFGGTVSYIDDWDLIYKYQKDRNEVVPFQPTYYPRGLIDYYSHVYPLEWLQEGIQDETMDKFGIRFDVAGNKIVIPQRDINGNLIGIRARALNRDEVESGRKYMPVIIQNTIFRHPTAYNLYGLYENQETIKQVKKILIFEAEKSVLKCDGFYGVNNFTVAVCGSNISNYQRNLILSLGVKEVFIAFDKEYEKINTKESDVYAEKILNLAHKFSSYVTTYVLWDYEGLLEKKDSPADKGKEVLETLMHNKIEVTTKEE